MRQFNASRERGGALIYVFVGLALFAGLMFTFTRAFHSSSDISISQQSRVLATDIIAYSNQVERSVATLIAKGCSESELSFENPQETGYTNAAAPTDKRCNVFDMEGGKLQWIKPPVASNDGSPWLITDNPVNTADGTTGNIGTALDDLVLMLPNVTIDVCSSINSILSIPQPWPISGSRNMTKFTGSFGGIPGSTINNGNNLPVQAVGCFCDNNTACSNSTNYVFYRVLLVR